MPINLLEETMEALKKYNVSINDIVWVGNNKKSFYWGEFESLAKHIDYFPSTFGSEVINTTLIICGLFWWIERDPSKWNDERWVFQVIPFRKEYKEPTVNDLKDTKWEKGR